MTEPFGSADEDIIAEPDGSVNTFFHIFGCNFATEPSGLAGRGYAYHRRQRYTTRCNRRRKCGRFREAPRSPCYIRPCNRSATSAARVTRSDVIAAQPDHQHSTHHTLASHDAQPALATPSIMLGLHTLRCHQVEGTARPPRALAEGLACTQGLPRWSFFFFSFIFPS